MSQCRYGQFLSAYHDGELEPGMRRELEAHLKVCAPCTVELAALRDVVARIAAGLPEATGAEMAAMHEAVGREISARESRASLARTAGLLAALAASVLIVAGAWLWDLAPSPGGSVVPQAPLALGPDWERVAVTLRADPRPAGDDSLFSPQYAAALDFMLSNLAPRERKPWAKPNS